MAQIIEKKSNLSHREFMDMILEAIAKSNGRTSRSRAVETDIKAYLKDKAIFTNRELAQGLTSLIQTDEITVVDIKYNGLHFEISFE